MSLFFELWIPFEMVVKGQNNLNNCDYLEVNSALNHSVAYINLDFIFQAKNISRWFSVISLCVCGIMCVSNQMLFEHINQILFKEMENNVSLFIKIPKMSNP